MFRKMNPRVLALSVIIAVVGLLAIADLAHRSASSSTGSGGSSTVIAVPQSAAGTDPATGPTSVPATSSAATTAAAAADDGAGDAPATTVTATVDPAATEAATAFSAAWLNTYKRTAEQWQQGLLPRVTEQLGEDLQGADPSTVPAGGRVGTVKMGHDAQLTVAAVQVVTAAGPKATLGTLHLSLVHRAGGWLISEIDWTAAT
jgi:hypothetical protein